jgi:hypothetical protein
MAPNSLQEEVHYSNVFSDWEIGQNRMTAQEADGAVGANID